MSKLKEGVDILLEDGLNKFLNESRASLRRSLGGALSCSGILGTNVFSKSWDVLIILDTCRVDAIKQVQSEYDFLDEIGQITSVGATSAEWMAATFRKKYSDTIKNTAYLANNGFAYRVFYEEHDYTLPDPFLFSWDTVDGSDFGKLEHIWRYELVNDVRHVGHTKGSASPAYVTDRGIAINRNYDFNRTILHYNKPHSAYTANALNDGRDLYKFEEQPFEYLKKGGNKNKVFESYIDDLRYVLDSVEVLLENIDAGKVVITADHGEAFGEFNTYCHPFGSLNPYIRRVPWVVTSAKDSKEYTPEFDVVNPPENEEKNERDVDTLLESLGYK